MRDGHPSRKERRETESWPLDTDHIAHHILTIYALAASPATIQKQYDRNKSYQRPPPPLENQVVEDLYDLSKFQSYLGNADYYRDFLIFFQQEIAKRGYEDVINEYVLKGDDRADDMLARMYAGEFVHNFSSHIALIINRLPPPLNPPGLRRRVQAACYSRRSSCTSCMS